MTRSRDLYTGPADVQDAFRSLNDDLQKVRENAIIPGRLIKDRAFASGDNTILHGLGKLPEMWHISRPRGAYGTSGGGGGGGGSIYPDIAAHKRWESNNQHSSDTTASYTMGFTPTDGNRLLALITHSTDSYTVSSMSQTGVTWTKVVSCSSASAGLLCELWVGTGVSSASTSLSVVFNTSSSGDSSICVMEIAELDSDTARNSASGNLNVNGSHFDIQDFLTAPVPNAGDISLVIVGANALTTTRSPPSGTGWRMLGYTHHFGVGGTIGAALYVRVAQTAAAQPFLGHATDNGFYTAAMVNFASSLTAVGGGGSTSIPHGLREVSRSKDTLVLNALTAFTADLWVA